MFETLLFQPLPAAARVALILALAIAGHLVVRGLHRVLLRIRVPGAGSQSAAAEVARTSHPKFATVLSLVESAVVFVIYFVAIGVALDTLGVDPTAYFATATVIGLAVGFGSQGLVQDVVIGLTLLFSDAFDVGDMVEVSGQIGRVERLGLRFTTIVNVHGQRVYVPNRNITVVGRFLRGSIRAYVDAQLPEGVDEEGAVETVRRVVEGFRSQHRSIVLKQPEILGVRRAGEGWSYVRVKMNLWPGQGALVETTLRQRLAAALRQHDPGYADWMVSVIYRAARE